VSLAVTNGTLRLSQTTGLTIVSGADGSSAVGVKGTLADLNAALDGLTFIPDPNFHGSAGIGLSINDLGNTGLGGAKRSSSAVAIIVDQVSLIQPLPGNYSPPPPAVPVPVGANQSPGPTGTARYARPIGSPRRPLAAGVTQRAGRNSTISAGDGAAGSH